MHLSSASRQASFSLALFATVGFLGLSLPARADVTSGGAEDVSTAPESSLTVAADLEISEEIPVAEVVEQDAIAPADTLSTSSDLAITDVQAEEPVADATNLPALAASEVMEEAIATPAPAPDDTADLLNTLGRSGALTPSQPRPSSMAQIPSVSNLSSPTASSMGQVTSITQLSDVYPTDWAYQALQSLVERYGCIAGYPDGTFRGRNFMTRYEFAAGLNACMDRINELITYTYGPEGPVTRADLEALQRLQEEFAAELATLRGRVDALEARTDELEANQFSTTTKLFGQVILGVQDRTDNTFEFFRDEFDDEYNTNVITNVQLNLLTQFSPRTILLTGLQAGDGSTLTGRPALNTFTGLGYEGDTDNDFEVSDLTLRHLVTDDLAFIVGAIGVNPVNVFRGAGRVESAGLGPISRFAQRNPIINIGNGRGGVGFDWQAASWLSLQGVYSASAPGDPVEGGIFGGENGATSFGAQLVASVTPDIDLAFQYINAYSPFGNLGTGIGDDQVAVLNGVTSRAPIQTNAFGSSLEWRATSGLTLGGWVGYTTSDLLGESGSVETLNWMAYLNFPDLFAEGNLGGLYVGQPPRIIDSDLPAGRNVPSLINEGSLTGDGGQPSTATHVEAFYRFRVSDNIYLTPGVIVIFNPGHNNDNDTIAIGALRTTFTF